MARCRLSHSSSDRLFHRPRRGPRDILIKTHQARADLGVPRQNVTVNLWLRAVNHSDLTCGWTIDRSIASCTTNCFAPVALMVLGVGCFGDQSAIYDHDPCLHGRCALSRLTTTTSDLFTRTRGFDCSILVPTSSTWLPAKADPSDFFPYIIILIFSCCPNCFNPISVSRIRVSVAVPTADVFS